MHGTSTGWTGNKRVLNTLVCKVDKRLMGNMCREQGTSVQGTSVRTSIMSREQARMKKLLCAGNKRLRNTLVCKGNNHAWNKYVSVYKKQGRKEQDSVHGTGIKLGEQACMDQVVCAGNKAAWNDWRAAKNKYLKKTPRELCALIMFDYKSREEVKGICQSPYF